jgi:hypothetical protein
MVPPRRAVGCGRGTPLAAQDDMTRDPVNDVASAPRRGRWVLAALCLVIGMTAIAGGVTLVARPDGGLLELPRAALDHTPFTSLLIPGLILLFVIGLGNLVAGLLVAADHPRGNPAAVLAGAALVGWIVVQMILLRTVDGLQVAYLLAGLATMAAARHRGGAD